MRSYWLGAVLFAAVAAGIAGPAHAAGALDALFASDCACQQGACDARDPCADPCGGHERHRRGYGKGHGHGHGHHKQYEGRSLSFNCGCNGSYKFPVPPLYTYHWPGMWSAQLMTDYHSPWRFPPLKRYTDEVLPAEMGQGGVAPGQLQPISFEAGQFRPDLAEPASFSSHIERLER